MTAKNPSLWTQSKTLETLSKQSLFNLFNKQIPGILIPHFIPEADCEKIVSILLKEEFSNYSNTPNIEVGKFGLSHMECFCEGKQAQYFNEAGAAQKTLRIRKEKRPEQRDGQGHRGGAAR